MADLSEQVVLEIHPAEGDSGSEGSSAPATASLGSDTGETNLGFTESETGGGPGGGAHRRSPSCSPPIMVEQAEQPATPTKEGLTEKQYEEYFIPVNEYKKSLRGEKLYLSKQKESKTDRCGKIFCWSVSLLLLAGAIAVAILIGSKNRFIITLFYFVNRK